MSDDATKDPIQVDGRLPPITLDELIASIRPMSVLERVELHALGSGTMTQTELAAAKLYLSKTQPDLKAVEHSGKGGGPIEFTAHLKLVKPDPSP